MAFKLMVIQLLPKSLSRLLLSEFSESDWLNLSLGYVFQCDRSSEQLRSISQSETKIEQKIEQRV